MGLRHPWPMRVTSDGSTVPSPPCWAQNSKAGEPEIQRGVRPVLPHSCLCTRWSLHLEPSSPPAEDLPIQPVGYQLGKLCWSPPAELIAFLVTLNYLYSGLSRLFVFRFISLVRLLEGRNCLFTFLNQVMGIVSTQSRSSVNCCWMKGRKRYGRREGRGQREGRRERRRATKAGQEMLLFSCVGSQGCGFD